MKIATFNVNSIRKRMPIVVDWLKANKPDVLCLQETKVQDLEFPLEPLQNLGYHVSYRGMKGYNEGVATLSLEKPGARRLRDLKKARTPKISRIIQTVIHGFFRSSTLTCRRGFSIESPKYEYKLAWFRRLHDYFKEHLDPAKPALWLGDLNVAPGPLDVHSPERHKKHPCYHEDARNAYSARRWVGVSSTCSARVIRTRCGTRSGIFSRIRSPTTKAGASITSWRQSRSRSAA